MSESIRLFGFLVELYHLGLELNAVLVEGLTSGQPLEDIGNNLSVHSIFDKQVVLLGKFLLVRLPVQKFFQLVQLVNLVKCHIALLHVFFQLGNFAFALS